ncbi:hypothetical protein BG011_009623 [Mortierella polycephala]|uniref:NDT80 domain-containing protein n=1 Tax=Mortierella polycephala TaxID=41804 RepID=A0A9P6PN15_9FUNG|nr:hypothetical protein BG011_009623 [Mortierella polycephala]
MPYSASTPSPTSPQASMAPRSKRRSEVYASHESPFFYSTQQHYRLMSMDQSTIYSCKLAAKIDRGFFLASNDWTCYRRNYFQISASFSIVGLDTSIYSEVPCLLEIKDELVQVQKFLICIGAQIQNGEKTIELFKTATANNGKRRAAQQYYQVRVDLFAETEMGELIMVATSFSAPLVVRGRSPGHYADNDEGVPGSSAQSIDERYSYRNDSISSSSGGGPIGSTVGSDYSYYPNYSYGSSYQYQSLGSASHMAAQSNDHGYYERHGSEPYPTSPLSPVNQHPGAIDTSLPPHPHPYMAPQVQHGFSPASVSPDIYSAPGFITPDGGNRLPHLQSHPQNGHYPYGSPAYTQYSQQQQQEQHDQYQAQQGQQDDDHEAQLAALQIHSPLTPSSPIMSPAASRRQSFSSSLSAKKNDRSSVGPTRKSRSISISGISKRAPSKTRTCRTIPTTPTKELVKGLGISNDRIPELEEHQA